MNNRILIVEDEKNLGETLSEYLNTKNYQCLLAQSADQARSAFNLLGNQPHIVLMDIGLPDGNGIDLASEFRQLRKDVVILFLSAQNDPDTRVKGLEIGAYDYITKPFNLKELELRLERIVNSIDQMQQSPDELTIGKLKIWFKRYQVSDANGNIIELSQKECEVLKMLYMNSNEAVTRDQMIEQIWGENSFPSNRTIDNYIVKLRKWYETDLQCPFEISSIRGIGYKLIIK